MVDSFARRLGDELARLPGVEAVALGGSRAQGTARADSDWDLAIYYRDTFDPDDLRRVGWPGVVSDIGGWGGGVFNGGAWLTVEGRAVDIHYRDLAAVERERERAERGEFGIEPLMFHLAGIPTYIILAELAINRVLVGDLLRPEYPPLLSERASAEWARRAQAHLDYAASNHAARGRVTQCFGLVAVAAAEAAHAVLAANRMWATNDKRLLDEAGLSIIDGALAAAGTGRDELAALVDEVRERVAERLRAPR
jgi:predicted nucleotidyltransferase